MAARAWEERSVCGVGDTMRLRTTRPVELLTAGFATLCLAAPAAAAPPTQTLEALEEALEMFECWGDECTYTLRFRTEIAKADGADAKVQIRRMEITVGPDGESSTHTLEVLQDGVDVTDDEDAQASFGKTSVEEDQEIEQEKEEDSSMSLDLSLPLGEDAAHYLFGETVDEGGLKVAPFEPVDGKSRKELTGLSAGRLAWDPDTLEPRWVEFGYARNPRMVKSMSSRLVLGQMEGKLIPLAWNTEGVGGFLLFKRRLVMEMSIEALR
jgi:hypothetical protein